MEQKNPTLEIEHAASGQPYVKFRYANGLGAMHSETYVSDGNAIRAHGDIENAMVEYLRSKGYTVIAPEA